MLRAHLARQLAAPTLAKVVSKIKAPFRYALENGLLKEIDSASALPKESKLGPGMPRPQQGRASVQRRCRTVAASSCA